MDPITDRVAQILATDPDIFVPVKRLYNDLFREGLLAWTPWETFVQLLEADERFEFVEGPEEEFMAEEDVAELETLGFYGGVRVKLVTRDVSQAEVMGALLRNLQRMNLALEEAWKHRPPNDLEAEAQLTQMLLLGDMMERQVKELLEESSEE